MDLDVKIQGFYSTVNRFLESYDEEIGQCNRLVEQIQEHKKQIRSCENVDVDDFKIESINLEIKALVLQKLQDKVNQHTIELNTVILKFKSNSMLLRDKLEKCVKLQFRPSSNDDIMFAQYFTWAFEISDIFEKHALKCDYLLENFNLLQTGDDAENNDVIAEDESDAIFGHDISKPVWSRDFEFSYGDKEKLICKLKEKNLSIGT